MPTTILLLVVLASEITGVTEPNATISQIEALQTRVAEQDATIRHLKEKLAKLRADLAESQKQHRRLKLACKRAGLSVNELLNGPRLRPRGLQGIRRLYGQLAIGQVGFLDKFVVRQIVDANNVLVDLEVGPARYSWQRWRTARNTTSIVPVQVSGPATESLWLCDVNVQGLVDGQELRGWGPFIISETKTYQTITGSQTVFLLRPFKPAPYSQQTKAADNPQPVTR
jgi:uncharacterized coiled-coil protein SlyX